MAVMRRRFLAASAALAGALSIGVPMASADVVSTSGPASNITATSATLHGVVSTADPMGAGWVFQYGTSQSYGNFAPQPARIAATGTTAVSVSVSNLTPNTTYHFRLVVVQGTYNSVAHNSSDVTFQTPSASSGQPPTGKPPGKKSPGFGTAALKSRSLAVSKGRLAVPMRCSGKTGSRCRGSLTVRAPGAQGRSLRCAGASFSLSAGSSRTLHPSLRSSCLSLLNAAPRHRVSATLLVTFSTRQASLSLPVTLHQ